MGAKKEVDISTMDLITIEECVIRLQALWKMDRPPYSKKTIQNRLSANRYKRYGPRRFPLVDWTEVKSKELRENVG
jgi:hypothetical protein